MQKNKWISLLCVLCLSLAFVACGEEAGTDGGPPPGEAILDGVATPDLPPVDGGPPPAEYKYVKIEDLSTVTGAQDGADIDAVELDKSGTSSWAASVVSCKLPDASDCANPDKSTGASDAFCTDPAECYSNYELPTDNPATLPPYVALGGTGGTLILMMTDKIENGDTLNVYEVGNCAVSEACGVASSTNASPESVKVSVATSDAGPWIELLAASDTNDHPKVTITVSGL